EFSVPQRLRALVARAALWTRAGRPTDAVKAWQTILDDEALGRGTVELPGETRSAASAAAYAARQIGEIIRRHGPAVYEPIEQRARATLDGPDEDRRAAAIEHLGRPFPNAAATGPGLVELATGQGGAGGPGGAAWASRTFLRVVTAGAERATALAGLARAYENVQCWEAAKATWQRLDQEFGDQTLAALDPGRSVRVFVAE